jgi:hypothetical protein
MSDAAKDSGVRFFCGRLFIVSRRPIDELHEIARQMRIPARMFDNSKPYMPHYRLSFKKMGDALDRFGFCTLGGPAVQAMMEECYRRELDPEWIAAEAEQAEFLASIENMTATLKQINQSVALAFRTDGTA